ncbi:MAG: VOC family protein [Planctomycetes bacterium]|nr:VOC family protein [Planctomycetota bacterium]
MAVTQDHVHLRCKDFEAVLRFFVENLDAKEEGRAASGTVTLRIGGIVYKVSPKPAGPTLPHNEIYHLGFETDDLLGELEKMKACGAKVAQGPEFPPLQRPYAFVEGPDGIYIELIQRAK